MKRTPETSDEYSRRVKHEIVRDNEVIPRCFSYGWWMRYRRVDLTEEGFVA